MPDSSLAPDCQRGSGSAALESVAFRVSFGGCLEAWIHTALLRNKAEQKGGRFWMQRAQIGLAGYLGFTLQQITPNQMA